MPIIGAQLIRNFHYTEICLCSTENFPELTAMGIHADAVVDIVVPENLRNEEFALTSTLVGKFFTRDIEYNFVVWNLVLVGKDAIKLRFIIAFCASEIFSLPSLLVEF